MDDLPSSRVTPGRPFAHVGIDFTGPLLVKKSHRRNSRSSKWYLAVFVCIVIKSVRLEIVSDLSADAFIASYCATNFGANQQQRKIFDASTNKE